jgi:SAM-dependent methyltransferase
MNMFSGLKKLFSKRTRDLMRFDLKRMRTRFKNGSRSKKHPACQKLHFGCGSRQVEGWLNVDVADSDYDVDLGNGYLPWMDKSFDVALSQHVIEHLELKSELLPLLKELHRVLINKGQIWLSCPDIEKICRSYSEHKMADLITDREKRSRKYWGLKWNLDSEVGLKKIPSSHMINSIFYQNNEHRNLFDFELLEWLLNECGFTNVERIDEDTLLEYFPEFPKRGDDMQSLYVRAIAEKK